MCVIDSDMQSIFDQTKITNQIMVFSMLNNLSFMNYNQYNIIKFIGFKLIYYVIKLDIISFSIVFIELVFYGL